MTRPDGEAFIEVHADVTPYERELPRAVEKASKGAEPKAEKAGEGVGKAVADGASGELSRSGRKFAEAIEGAVSGERIAIDGKWYVLDRRGRLHDAAGRFVADFREEIESAFERVAASGGDIGGSLINRISTGFSDAIGAGFNVSGRSPLIAVLIPALGALVGVILAAVQAAGALVAILTTLPTILAGLGLQVGVLMLAFNGLGDAISGAFAAKNAKELNEALKGLQPSAQQFVRTLLQLKPLFQTLQRVSQQNFFKALGDPFAFLRFLTPTLIRGFGDLATRLGMFFRDLGEFFNSPTFIVFVKDIFPATARFIERFGSTFIDLLGMFIAMANTALPFLERIGMLINFDLQTLVGFIEHNIRGGGFTEWLASMEMTFQSVMNLLSAVIGFVATFMNELDKAGGRKIIDELTTAVEMLSFFFSTPVGQKAMEGLVNLAIISIRILTGLIIIITSFIALVEVLGEALRAFFIWVKDVALPAIGDFFGNIDGWFNNLTASVQTSMANVRTSIINAWAAMTAAVRNSINAAVDTIRGLPGRARTAIGDIGSLLFNAGRSLIQGFINGMRSMIGSVGNVAKDIVNEVTDFFPGSPAKKGPLSGEGYSLHRGERMVEDFGHGVHLGLNDLRNQLGSDMGAMVSTLNPQAATTTGVNFNSGAIRITFEGALPTEEQARQVGSAVAAGMSDQLARRDTRLGVRTL